jgi:hypothetical protein
MGGVFSWDCLPEFVTYSPSVRLGVCVCVCVRSPPPFRPGCLHFIVQGDATLVGQKRLNNVGPTQHGKHAMSASHLLRPSDTKGPQGDACVMITRPKEGMWLVTQAPLSILSWIYTSASSMTMCRMHHEGDGKTSCQGND